MKNHKFFRPGLIIGGVLLLAILGVIIFMVTSNDDHNGRNIDADNGQDVDYAYTPAPDIPFFGGEGERNLGGMEIVVANWWGDYDTDTFEPGNAQQQAVLDARRELEARYNFRLREVNMGNQSMVAEIAAASIGNQTPYAHIFVLGPQDFVLMNMNGLFAPLDGPAANFRDVPYINWNYATIDVTMINNIPHGWSQGGVVEGDGLFFNMRILGEAGVGSQFPFDFQLIGAWRWNYFLDAARQVAANTNAMPILATSHDFFQQALTSNGTGFVGYDPTTGQFYNPTTTPEFTQAIEFTQNLFNEGIVTSWPADASWDWHHQSFINGNAAMLLGGAYLLPQLANMEDPWGFVAFPTGPSADSHHFISIADIHAIPHTFSPQEVDAILFAWQMWTAAAHDAENADAWVASALHAHHDSRSVYETLMLHLRNPENAVPMLSAFIPGMQPSFITDHLWREGADTALIIEESQLMWDTLIDMANH